MTTATTVARTVVRVTGPVQLGTGLLLWTGKALAMLPVRLLSGGGLVLALWALAALAARAGGGAGRAALAGLWGALVVGSGLTQRRLLPGGGLSGGSGAAPAGGPGRDGPGPAPGHADAPRERRHHDQRDHEERRP
jgi:hypothetical protein